MQEIENNNLLINVPIPEYGDIVYYRERFGSLSYQLKKSLADGGEGKIYSGTGGKVYKIYKPHRLTGNAIKKLEAMIAEKPHLSDNICWPEDLIFEPSESRIPVGFSMTNVNAESRNIPTLEQLITNPVYHGKEWNRKDLVRVCIKTVELFEQLHKHNILMGDVNPKNILVDKYGNVFFIDVDSYQFKEFLCPVGMLEYVSPRIHGMTGTLIEIERTVEDELFAIITLIYRILFLNALPFPLNTVDLKDAIINHRFRFDSNDTSGDDYFVWKNLTPNLRKIFTDAFVEGAYANTISLKEALRELYSFMEKGFVSDDLLLVDFIDTNDIKKLKYEKAVCANCGIEFKAIEGKNNDSICQHCIRQRRLNRENIYRFACKSCKKTFTVNPWDSENADSENALCPDCDENASFPKNGFNNLNELKAKYNAALKNLSNNDSEDYI